MLRLSTSSWSLHAALGSPRHHPAPSESDLARTEREQPAAGSASVALLDLPAQLAAHGIGTLELCHFHLPSREASYLAQLRRSLERAGVELFSLLIDGGDITHADGVVREQDVHWISDWLDTASELGATHARVGAGRSEPDDEAVIIRSAQHLAALADYGSGIDVQVITENWQVTGRHTAALLQIVERCAGKVGLCVDFGNAEGPDKYDTLKALLPHAVSLHAKPRIDAAGQIDRDDLLLCMNMAVAAGVAGPVSLINTDRDDEWGRLDELRDLLKGYMGKEA